MKSVVIRWISRLGTLALFLAGVEAMARLDDYIHLGVPFLASPDNEHDLKLRESWGFRGRPHGLFRKWKLNEFGFRGPETTPQPAEGATRVLVLGASETFGLMESNNHEYPAQLQKVMQQEGKYDVINGGMTSLTAAGMLAYWDQWLTRFQPQIVVIYASPVFYLRDAAPEPLPVLTQTELASQSVQFQFRTIDRVSSLYRNLPSWIRAIRRDLQLRRQVAAHDNTWFFTTAPKDRLEKYRTDVAELVRRIRNDGAVPILVTHAISAASPPRSEDLAHLCDMRADFCRPTIETMTRFEKRANQTLRDLARDEGVPLIDVDAVLTGRRDFFGDLVHFNDLGAARMAELLAAGITRELTAQSPPTMTKSSASAPDVTEPASSTPRLPAL
jgi:lysophospholipase L1-like esterase